MVTQNMNMIMTEESLSIQKRGDALELLLKGKAKEPISFTTDTTAIRKLTTKQSFIDDKCLFEVSDRAGQHLQFEVAGQEHAKQLAADLKEAMALFAVRKWGWRDAKVAALGTFMGVVGLIVVAQSMTVVAPNAQEQSASVGYNAGEGNSTKGRSNNADAWTPQ